MPLGYLDRCAPVQRDPHVAGASLQGVSSGVTPFRFPTGLPGTIASIRIADVGLTAQCTFPSPAPGSSGPAGNPHPGDWEAGSLKTAWQLQGRKCETRVRVEPVCEQSVLPVVQDVRGLAGALVYDCRPPLLPVSIPLQDLHCSSPDRPTAPSSLVAAPVEVTPGFSGSVRERVATPGFVETPSDPGTDVEDELEYVSPLLTMTLPDSDAAIPISPARYLESPPPALAGSPTPPPVKKVLPTHIQFLTYTASPEHVLCAPVVSPVTMDLPETPRFPSPGSPAAMDQILAGNVDLVMDSASDLPSLPSLLLPIPSPHVLPPEPIVVHSAGGSPDLSREGHFDASQDSSVSEAPPPPPRVVDNLPGCQYRMTSYKDTQATTADPDYGLQLHNLSF